jgi:hypothetical protein
MTVKKYISYKSLNKGPANSYGTGSITCGRWWPECILFFECVNVGILKRPNLS